MNLLVRYWRNEMKIESIRLKNFKAFQKYRKPLILVS